MSKWRVFVFDCDKKRSLNIVYKINLGSWYLFFDNFKILYLFLIKISFGVIL